MSDDYVEKAIKLVGKTLEASLSKYLIFKEDELVEYVESIEEEKSQDF